MTGEQSARRMILCAGLQSGGTTLISWCFLQRQDTNGVLDMPHDNIRILFDKVATPIVWCKMTVGAFRWLDVSETYRDLGWHPEPLLIVRDVRTAFASLLKKDYGFNGTTAEEAPLRMRFRRFLRDWELFRANCWPIIKYEDFIRDERDTLVKACQSLRVSWDEGMTSWSKSLSTIAYVNEPNETFMRSIQNGSLSAAKLDHKAAMCIDHLPQSELEWLEEAFAAYNDFHGYPRRARPLSKELIPLSLDPPRFDGTSRHWYYSEIERLRSENDKLQHEIENSSRHSRKAGHREAPPVSRSPLGRGAGNVAVLIVNGGMDPQEGRWLELCLRKVREHTSWPRYQVYIWNNNNADAWVPNFVKEFPRATLVSANPSEKLAHPHAVPLQRLYEMACSDGHDFIIALDSDAHPIRSCWITQLVTALDDETVLAGVWRDELKKEIRPYIHASCLCTSVSFVEANNLRFDYIAPCDQEPHDTLSSFTDKVRELGLGVHKLRRSNLNQAHRLIGGIYGDLIYHHGAGSRPQVTFWDEPERKELLQANKDVRDRAVVALFSQYENYVAWLRGTNAEPQTLGATR